GSMGSFPELYANIQRSIGASERVLDILDEEPEPIAIAENNNDIEMSMQGALTFNHVGFTYPSRPAIPILKDISFHVEAGRKLACVGPSGTGKSSIAWHFSHLCKTKSGGIAYDG